MTLIQNSRRSEQGFTLVELAIVMVIIGILIAGILKGQELIANSRVSATVSQLKGTDAAFNTFFDKYNATPGDMLAPQNRLPNCANPPCNVPGNGNGRIDTPVFGNLPGNGDEAAVAFSHLTHADLISGIDDSSNTVGFGLMLPAIRLGGGMWISHAQAAVGGTTLNTPNHFAILNTLANVAAGSGSLTASESAQIDRKLDDGLPQSGSTQVDSGGTNCINGTNYDEAAAASACTLFVRALN